jgi:hypothetical protein
MAQKGQCFMVTTIIKWVSLPVLLIASISSPYAASYRLLVDCALCLSAIVLVQWAIQSKQYFWASGFLAAAVIVSPLLLVVKMFLLMGFAYTATSLTLLAAFLPQPLLARHPAVSR